MLYSTRIENRLSEYDNRFEYQCIDIFEFAEFLDAEIYNIIAEGFDEDFDFSVDVNYKPTIESTDIIIRGCYSSLSDNGGDSITLQLDVTSANPPSPTYLYMSKDKWMYVKYEIGQVIAHEVLHSIQHAKRNYKSGTMYKGINHNEKYFGSADEIQAYALNAAHDLMLYTKGNKTKAKKLITGNLVKIDRLMSTIIVSYRDTFAIPNPKIFRKFLKHTVKFLEDINE